MSETKSGRKDGFVHRLYTGTGAFDIVGKRKRFYLLFGAVVLVCVLGMVLRGFNFGIEFDGGTQIQMPAHGVHGTITVDQTKETFAKALGHQADAVQSVGTGGSASIQIRTADLTNADTAKLRGELFRDLGPIPNGSSQPSQQSISDSAVSASWGIEISQQALIALAVFLVLVAIFLALYFERWMAVAAIAALINDIVVTAGVYALVGFEVTPATVIGLLTILGFSLYDTVVVFDKIRENTTGLLKTNDRTYGEAANLGLNQTLMRSINTSLIALLPVLGLLIVGVGLLGVGTLTDLALVQLVGMISGALSSICLATPLLVDMKMRETPYRQQAARVLARRRGARADQDAEPRTGAAPRRETALAGASSVPARHRKAHETGAQQPSGKGQQPGRAQPGGKGQQPRRNGQQSTQRPTGNASRPTGKKRR